jgi:hypothetical protein
MLMTHTSKASVIQYQTPQPLTAQDAPQPELLPLLSLLDIPHPRQQHAPAADQSRTPLKPYTNDATGPNVTAAIAAATATGSMWIVIITLPTHATHKLQES